MKVLITLPDYEPAVNCVSEWNKHILLPVIKRNNIEHQLIEKQNVSIGKVSYMIEKTNPRFLILNGHGTIEGDCVCGQDGEAIISLGVNDGLLDSRIVHSFTCCSAKKLGKGSRADAFIGYDDVFMFWQQSSATTTPLKDTLAAPQMKSALVVHYEILKGKTTTEAHNASQKAYQEYINEYMWNSEKHTAEEMQRILPFLIWNMQHQKLIGNGHARL